MGAWGRQTGVTVTCSPIPEKMVTSEALGGVPILVLANKQDVEVSLPRRQGDGYLLQEGLPSWDTPSRVGCSALQRPAVQGAFSPLGGGRALSQPLRLEPQQRLRSSGENERGSGIGGVNTNPDLPAASPTPETWRAAWGRAQMLFSGPSWPDPRPSLGDCPRGWALHRAVACVWGVCRGCRCPGGRSLSEATRPWDCSRAEKPGRPPLLPTLGPGRSLGGRACSQPHLPQTCLSIPDIKTAFSDCTAKIGRRDCLTQACSALTG